MFLGIDIHDLFGGFGDRAGRVIRRPIRFSSIRRQVDVTKGEAEAHYCQLNAQVRSHNADDEAPLRQAPRDVVGNLVGTWRLTLRDLKPEYVGLLIEAIVYLDAHSDDFEMQLSGARNFGADIVDAEGVNPLYKDSESQSIACWYRSRSASSRSSNCSTFDCRSSLARSICASPRSLLRDACVPPMSSDLTSSSYACSTRSIVPSGLNRMSFATRIY